MKRERSADKNMLYSIQVNLPAETGDMGVLANHVPSIEQLKPGLVEVIEESGGSKQFFRAYTTFPWPTDYQLTITNSIWWFRNRPARLNPLHQRRRRFPTRGLQP